MAHLEPESAENQPETGFGCLSSSLALPFLVPFSQCVFTAAAAQCWCCQFRGPYSYGQGPTSEQGQCCKRHHALMEIFPIFRHAPPRIAGLASAGAHGHEPPARSDQCSLGPEGSVIRRMSDHAMGHN